MSQLAGAPVRLQFMRWDEHGWDNYGPAQHGGHPRRGRREREASSRYEYTAFAMPAHRAERRRPDEAARRASPLSTPGHGRARHGQLGHAVQHPEPARRSASRCRCSTTTSRRRRCGRRRPRRRVFASEQLIDELAYAAKMDPYEFRLQNISTTDQNRWRDVLVGVAELANWKPRVAASNLSDANVVTGRGIALGTYRRLAGRRRGRHRGEQEDRQDPRQARVRGQVSGLGVSLEGARDQMMGSLIMGTSRTLYEAVAFNTKRVTRASTGSPIRSCASRITRTMHVQGRPAHWICRRRAQASRRGCLLPPRSPTRSSTRPACASGRRR